MTGLDTNVLVRYLVQDDQAQSRIANELMSGLTSENPGFVGLIVLAELYWVLSRSYRLPREEILQTIEELASVDAIVVQDYPMLMRALGEARKGADFADALAVDAANRAGCSEFVTFDRRAAAIIGTRLLA